MQTEDENQTVTSLTMSQNEALSAVHTFHLTPTRLVWNGEAQAIKSCKHVPVASPHELVTPYSKQLRTDTSSQSYPDENHRHQVHHRSALKRWQWTHLAGRTGKRTKGERRAGRLVHWQVKSGRAGKWGREEGGGGGGRSTPGVLRQAGLQSANRLTTTSAVPGRTYVCLVPGRWPLFIPALFLPVPPPLGPLPPPSPPPEPPPAPSPHSAGAMMNFCSLVGCLTSRHHTSVSQGRICSDKFTCCHIHRNCRSNFQSHPITVYWHRADQPSADPITPGAWLACAQYSQFF